MNLLIEFLALVPQELDAFLFELMIHVFRAQLQSQFDLCTKTPLLGDAVKFISESRHINQEIFFPVELFLLGQSLGYIRTAFPIILDLH
jgi:hypothetical protein